MGGLGIGKRWMITSQSMLADRGFGRSPGLREESLDTSLILKDVGEQKEDNIMKKYKVFFRDKKPKTIQAKDRRAAMAKAFKLGNVAYVDNLY